MSIEIGSKWVKDGFIVSIFDTFEVARIKSVIYDDYTLKHILTESDFLEQYKPYEVVYEYQWALYDDENDTWVVLPDWEYENVEVGGGKGVRLDFTKRERKQ